MDLTKYGYTQKSKTVWEGNGIKIRIYKNSFKIDDTSYPIDKIEEIVSSYVIEKVDEFILDKINQRERQMLVHSYIYYRKGTSIVSDSKFDEWAYELVSLIKNYPNEFKMSAYYKDFKNFDGSTGFNLPYTYTEIMNKAEYLMTLV